MHQSGASPSTEEIEEKGKTGQKISGYFDAARRMTTDEEARYPSVGTIIEGRRHSICRRLQIASDAFELAEI